MKVIFKDDNSVKFEGNTSPGERLTIQTEKPVMSDLIKEIGVQDHFVDIGAFSGLYSILACNAGAASITALEPSRENFDRLEYNKRVNEVVFDKERVAVSDRNGKGYLSHDTIHPPTYRLGEGEEKEEVQLVKPEAVFRGIPDNHSWIVKIDTEGHEYNVLNGLTDRILKKIRIIYCEIHVEEGKENKKEEIIKGLGDYGFEHEILFSRESETFKETAMVKFHKER